MIITEKKAYESYINGNTVLAPEPEISQNEGHKENNNKKGTKKDKKISSGKLKALRNIGVTFIIGVTLIGRYSMIYGMQRELNAIGLEINTINKENENLRVELVKFNNLQYIEDVATKKLNMVSPTKSNIMYCNLKNEMVKASQKQLDTQKDEGFIKNFFSKLF
ncbi:cell division protein FtsL [Clostridium pascui]|uniref:septum formation initiator family protein n=1 Tax=Clostridium pascui TaxID=46609 RepID=UPI00195787C7|nr:cell division protein FtsL [Clostridium pascui]